jgi:hypothetical protein
MRAPSLSFTSRPGLQGCTPPFVMRHKGTARHPSSSIGLLHGVWVSRFPGAIVPTNGI